MIDYEKAFELVMEEYGVLDELGEHIRSASVFNRAELDRSARCACFSCGEIIDSAEISDWCDEEGTTAVCPHCHSDGVVAESSGIPFDANFMAACQKALRARDDELSESRSIRHVCVIHRPLHSVWMRGATKPEGGSSDDAVIVFDGELGPGIYTFLDGEAEFWIEMEAFGARTRIRYGPKGIRGETEYVRDGVPYEIHVPLCDAEEGWGFVISRCSINAGKAFGSGIAWGAENTRVIAESLGEHSRYFHDLD